MGGTEEEPSPESIALSERMMQDYENAKMLSHAYPASEELKEQLKELLKSREVRERAKAREEAKRRIAASRGLSQKEYKQEIFLKRKAEKKIQNPDKTASQALALAASPKSSKLPITPTGPCKFFH